MCVELFVDNILVYSDCESPSPTIPSSFLDDMNIPPTAFQSPSPFLDDTNIAPSSLITDLITTVNTLNTTLNTTQNTTRDMYKSTSNYLLPDNTLTYVLISAFASIPCIICCVIALCRRKKKTQPRRLAKKKKRCCKCAKEKKLPVRQPKGTQTRTIIKDSS